MKTFVQRFLAFFLLLCGSAFEAAAQLNVDIEFSRRQFIPHESIPMSVRLTNRAGAELLLHGDNRRSWLNVLVQDQQGNPVAPYRPMSFQAAKIPVGRSVAKQLDLNNLFPLHSYGKYTVSTIITLPTGESFQSARKTIDLTRGRVIYEQRVGLGGKARDYRLITFTPARTSMLYFQAELVDERRVVMTYPLGEHLRHMHPEGTVDRQGRLNVLYLAAPDRYVHILIDSRGQVADRTIYKQGQTGKPRLVAFDNGEIQVAGGIEFDPEAQQAQRDRIRKISERPAVLFD
ncbi:hypothetical protein [Roseibacillus ishigakijimensis]|uniref:P pilus assembly protein, chaperone PapD n=1 Tax=Roseibacillus ishigakijimensis TaxID=454146 RepID=A0A934RM26_9BACT|nr:hypothetical protein [Roseibacillus ishigakijimensis]MBK1833275.1 hypothetical protein [Roseibacillus ishigakijimensis]